jgi:hypothetical protein
MPNDLAQGGVLAGTCRIESLHILRHTCAPHMVANRASIRFIQQLLGHENSTPQPFTPRSASNDLRKFTPAIILLQGRALTPLRPPITATVEPFDNGRGFSLRIWYAGKQRRNPRPSPPDFNQLASKININSCSTFCARLGN